MGNQARIGVGVDDKASGPIDRLVDKFHRLQKQGAKGLAIGAGAAVTTKALNLVGGALAGVGDVIGGTVTKAAAFEKGMLNVNSIAKLSSGELDSMGDKVLKLSGDLGQSQEALTSALYDISSSGFAGAQAFDILKASAKSATAGLSDAGTAAKGITAVLNSYGLEAKDAAHVSDVMFQTVNRGVVTFEELSAEIGKTTALASPLGVSLEEVGAGLAVMTRHGIDAENATTQLNAIMAAVLQPSSQAADLAKALGIEWNTAGLKAKGLSGFLSDMIAKTGGSQEKMATLLGDVRAIRGAFTLGAQGGKELTDELGQFQNVAGVTNDVLGVQKQGLAFKAAQATEKFNALSTTLGQRAIPALSEFLYFVDKTQIPLEKIQEAAAHGVGGAMAQFAQLQEAANELGMSVEDTYTLMAEVGSQNVDDLKAWQRSSSDELDRSERSYNQLKDVAKKDLKAVGDAATDAGTDTVTALQKVIDESNKAQKALNDLADEALGDYFDPMIEHDKLLADQATLSAARRVLASGKATAAEKRDARATIHEMEKSTTESRVKLFEAGKLSKKEQATLLKDLKADWKTATGAAKIEIAGLIAEIERLQESSGVTITVGGGGGKKKHARGGYAPAGEVALFGEEGPELGIPRTGMDILTAAQTRRVLGGGGRSSGPLGDLHIHVHGVPLTPAITEAFVRQAGPALVDYLHRRGF